MTGRCTCVDPTDPCATCLMRIDAAEDAREHGREPALDRYEGSVLGGAS